MKREKTFLPRLTLSASLMLPLILSMGCQESPPEKAQVLAYPPLWKNFDKDFHHTLETALKKEFQGECVLAIENKKSHLLLLISPI